MTLRKVGEWLKGSEASDIDEYLVMVTADGYPVDKVVHPICSCGTSRFKLLGWREDPELERLTYPQRICMQCGNKKFICDDCEFWEEIDHEGCLCQCGGPLFEIGVGFSHRWGEETEELNGLVRWITVGVRCVQCGSLACFFDWKISHSPTDHIYGEV